PFQSQASPGARNSDASRRSPPPGTVGAGEKPHMPVTSVVTPCRSLDSAEGTWSREKSEWACMSMKPGVTRCPRASITRPDSPSSSGAMAATRSPRRPTSATWAGAPLPSTTAPPRMSQSKLTASGLGGLLDLDRLHLVADGDLIDDLHPLHHLPE